MILLGAVALAFGMTLWLGGREPMPMPAPGGDGSAQSAAVSAEQPVSAEQAAAADSNRAAAPAVPVLTGRLMQNERPLGGVEVFACRGQTWRPSIVHRLVTAPDGTFTLPQQELAFWLTADGGDVPHNWKTRTVRAWQGRLDFVVPVPGSIVGVVRDRAGVPIAGATVRRISGSYRRVAIGDDSAVMAVSDARGRFRFDRVGDDDGRLHCQADGYAVQPSHTVEIGVGEHATTEIVLNAGSTLRGLVMDHRGRALAGAEVVGGDGQVVVTNAVGQFAIEHFRGGASLTVAASGHLSYEDSFVYGKEPLRIRLERAVTLHGKVIGSLGKPGMVYVGYAANERPDASKRMSHHAIYDWLDIVRDGEFKLSALAMSDFEVTVRIPGVGAVGPVRVEMRDDRVVEFAIKLQHELTVSVLDAAGLPVPGAKLIRDDGILEYDSLYRCKQEELQHRIRSSSKKLPPLDADQGELVLGVPPGESVAFLVTAPGFLDVAHTLLEDAIGEHHPVVMERAGSLRGVVRGGSRKDYRTAIHVVPKDAPRDVKSGTEDRGAVPRLWRTGNRPRVAADGTFIIKKIRPGSYLAYVSRSNTARPSKGSIGIPLIDDGDDVRDEQQVVVVAGEETVVEFDESPLGCLRGRVLVRGVPVAKATIVAARPRAKKPRAKEQAQYVDLWAGTDWDGGLGLAYEPGHVTGSDGAFVFAYRDAGPLEIRVRHQDGSSVSAPFVINLPPPGEDVLRDIEIPCGEIRGRYPVELLSEAQRKTATVTLYPMHRTLHDPFYETDYVFSLSSDCATIKDLSDGRFVFSFLRPGSWLVRLHHSTKNGNVLAWQKVLDVRGDVVDVGELPLAQPVQATVKWRWADKCPGRVRGFWLRSGRDGGDPIWVATLLASKDGADALVLPGRYLAVPFGYFDPDNQFSDDLFMFRASGDPIGKPAPIEIRSDGSVVPKIVEFSPLPVPAKENEHK